MATLRESYETGADAYESLSDTIYQAQTWQSSVAFNIDHIEIYGGDNGTPGTVTVAIRACTTNVPATAVPTGNNLCSATFNGEGVSIYTWSTAAGGTLTGYSALAATSYALVVYCGGNYFIWRDDESTPTYANGGAYRSVNSGSTWTDPGQLDWDFYFRIYGDPAGGSPIYVPSYHSRLLIAGLM